MPRLRVEPLGVEIEALEGESVMEAAERSGYFWPIGCDHAGECTNCAMEVIAGASRLSTMGRYERANILRQRGDAAVADPRLRLACQARIRGDAVVYKRGVALR